MFDHGLLLTRRAAAVALILMAIYEQYRRKDTQRANNCLAWAILCSL